MIKIYSSLKSFIILPGIFVLVAAMPFSCNVAKEGGIFKSENFGENWQQKVTVSKKETLASHQILAMELDPFNPNIIYAGTENGLYRSDSGADSWELVQDEKKNPDARASILDIKISPQNSNLIYAAVYQGRFGRVLRSTNSDSPWEQMYIVSKEGVSITAIEVDKKGQNIYIGTSEGGLLESADFGLSWKIIGWFNAAIKGVKINSEDGRIIYVLALNKGIFKTSDQGVNWQLLADPVAQNSGSAIGSFTGGNIRDFLIDARSQNSLYAGTDKGIFLSSDGGQTWRVFSSLISPESAPISAIAQDIGNPTIFYYGAASIVYRTQNNGQTWTVHQLPSSKQINLIKVDPIDSNIIYVGVK